MESAAALLQEAIADINTDCPDELAQYRELISGLFGNAPTAMITGSSNETDPDLGVPPTPPTSPTPETTTDEWDEPQATQTVVEVISEVVTDGNRDVEEIMTALSTISWQEFKQMASPRGIKVVGRSKVDVTADFRKLLETADAQAISMIRGAITAAQQKKLPTERKVA